MDSLFLSFDSLSTTTAATATAVDLRSCDASQVDPDLVRLEFIEVIVEGSRAGTRKSQRSLARRRKRDSAEDGSFSGLYVVGVTAMKGRSPVYLTTPTGSAYIRRDGSVHKMDQVGRRKGRGEVKRGVSAVVLIL